MIAYQYRLMASPGRAEDLRDALVALAKALTTLPGAERSVLMRDTREQNCFIFLENWVSVSAHDAGAARLPEDAMPAVLEPLAGKPELRILEILR